MSADALRDRARRLAAAALAALAGVLGACGVGGEGTGGSAGPVMLSGRIEGFGSVVVAGSRLAEGGAEAVLEVDPRRPEASPAAGLRLGMVVRVDGEAGEARRIVTAPEVVGPVQGVDAVGRRVVVAGQTVRLDAVAAEPTVLDGLRAPADLRPGERVRVWGDREADGTLLASRLEREPADAAVGGVRVAGRLEPVPGGGWRIGALAIRVDAGTERRPAGRSPAAGDRLVAWGPRLDAEGRLQAAVLAWPEAPAEDASATLAGLVTGPDAAGRPVVRGQPVDAAGLSAVERGRLVVGARVRVDGRVQAGVVRAARVDALDPAVPATAEIAATVSDALNGRTFSVRGTPVDAGAARFEALTPANIANGVPVVVQGRVTPGGVVATAVLAVRLADGVGHAQAGTVTRLDRGAATLRLEGLQTAVRVAADAVYRGGVAADLADGVAVVLRGATEDGHFVARIVEFAGAAATVEIAGLAGNVEADIDRPGHGEFEIGAVDMAWTPATVFRGPTGTAADLADGRFARVRGVRVGAVLQATEVDLRPTQPGVVRLRGTVTAVTSPQDFRIDGQRVDARAAVFEPDGLRLALRGAYVDVEGRMQDGVLVATRVSDP